MLKDEQDYLAGENVGDLDIVQFVFLQKEIVVKRQWEKKSQKSRDIFFVSRKILSFAFIVRGIISEYIVKSGKIARITECVINTKHIALSEKFVLFPTNKIFKFFIIGQPDCSSL